MKISILYHSNTGNTERVAHDVATGASKVDKVEVKTMSISNIDETFLDESKVVIVGFPTYAGTFSWQIKQWLDTYKNVKLGGKLGAVFATENYVGGGADVAELAVIGQLLVKGLIVYSAGVTEGQPYTHYGAVAIKDGDEVQKERAVIFGERIARKGVQLFC